MVMAVDEEKEVQEGVQAILAHQPDRIEFRYGPAPLTPNQRVRLA